MMNSSTFIMERHWNIICLIACMERISISFCIPVFHFANKIMIGIFIYSGEKEGMDFGKRKMDFKIINKMEDINKKIAKEINKLISVNYDSKLAYENADRIVREQSYDEAFLYLAKDKESHIDLLKMQVLNLGATPVESGTRLGEVRLASMNVKS